MKKPDYIAHNLSLYGIDLKRLERETYNLLFLGLVVAVLFHAGLLVIFPGNKTKVADKNSIQVDLVKIPPRITRPSPIIISKNTTREISHFRRKSGAGVPSAPRGLKNPSGIDYGEIKMLSAAPGISIGNPIDTLSDSIIVEEHNLRNPKDNVPLKNEVFIDTGQYKSMVVFSPDNKMAVQGYTHLASICGKNFFPPDSMLYALKNLAGALNFFTNIKTDCNWRVGLNTQEDKPLELNRYPVIYISNDKPFTLTEAERDNLKNYISSGGFIILDNPLSEISEGRVGKSLKNVVIEAFSKFAEAPYIEITPVGPVTKYRVSPIIPEISFIPIPENHELFHSFFDFINGPPGGYWDDSDKKNIEGIYLGGRLIGLYTVGYGLSWNDKRNEEQLKMGVNMVVYALKQGKGKFDWGHITTKTPNRPSVVFTGSGKMKNLSRGNIKAW